MRQARARGYLSALRPSGGAWSPSGSQPLVVRVATSGEQTSLFIAPPLIVEEAGLMRILAALDHGLELADAEVERVA